MPPEIYIPLVDSLFKDGRTLLAGTFFVTGSIFVTYWKTGEPLLLGCALAILLVAGARGLLVRAYGRVRSKVMSAKAARRWEYRYVAGAAASLALLGMWCFLTLALTSDPFAVLVSFSMTIAYATGIFGRNFGSARFVVVQIFCAWAPMTAALLLYGNHYHWIFAGMLVPSFFGMKFIAERLRRTLLDAVIASRDMTLLATRFDTALNNMPHGLCMFDAERHIVVSNQKLNQQLGLAPDFELKGFSMRRLVESVAAAGQLSDASATSLIERLDARLSGSEDSAFDVDMESGRTLEFTLQPMENGGMVILVEDITERRIAEAKINHLARFDALTGLPNRTILHDRMERALSEWRPDNMCAIHFVDLDQFKQVNDTLGHTRGDMLLKAVAERLQGTVGDAGCDLALRRRRVRHSAGADPFPRARRGARHAGAQRGQRHLRSRRPQGSGHRQHRNRAGHHRARPGPVPAQRRHGAVLGEGRGPRHVALVRDQDGSQRPGAPQS